MLSFFRFRLLWLFGLVAIAAVGCWACRWWLHEKEIGRCVDLYQPGEFGFGDGDVWLLAEVGEPLFPSWNAASATGVMVRETPDNEADMLLLFPRVRCLTFESIHVSPTWLTRLKELPDLETVHFCGSDFSDDGFESLVACKKLKYLCLHQARTTALGQRRFAEARPDVRLSNWYH